MAGGGPWDALRLRRGDAFFAAVKTAYLLRFVDPTAPISHRPTARLLVCRRRQPQTRPRPSLSAAGQPEIGGAVAIGTYRRSELSVELVGACRRLQQQVFDPDPARPGHFHTAGKPEAELAAGSELAAEVSMVQASPPATGERYHLAIKDGVLLAKAQTHTRAVRLANGEFVTILALTGVNTSPAARGRGFGKQVVRLAFNQLLLQQSQAADRPEESPAPPVCCLFQTGAAITFYLQLGCRRVDTITAAYDTYAGLLTQEAEAEAHQSPSGTNAEAIVNSRAVKGGGSSIGPPAFTDFNAMVYPADGLARLKVAAEQAGKPCFPIDSLGYTGSWAWWAQPVAPGEPPQQQRTHGAGDAKL